MKNERLNTDRCFNLSDPDRDDLGCHRWRALPLIEQTEHGPIAWHTCERCPARALLDPETEDGFEEEPIVVYPPSCFDVECSAAGAPIGSARCDSPGCTWGCGCPAKASGDPVHLDGCPEFQASVEQALRQADGAAFDAERRAEPAPPLPERISAHFPSYGMLYMVGARPEPLPIVHPPTDPAPPSEELARAMSERSVVVGQIMEDAGCSRAEAERDLDETLRPKTIIAT